MKSAIFKATYLFFVMTIGIIMICELFLVIERRSSNQQVKESRISKENMFTQKPRREDDTEIMETLWEIPWEKYRPNAELDGIIGRRKIVVKINSHGYRTQEFEVKKPEGVYRIICIGASTTYQGATNESTYPAILEEKLRKRYPDRKIEVLNFGISGTRSDFWISRLDKLFGFEPDMIVQYNAVNDLTGPYLSRIDSTCISKTRLTYLKALNMSFLYQKLFPLEPSIMDKCFMLTFSNFNRIASEARSRNIEYIVGTFAAPDYSRATGIIKYNLDYNFQRSWGSGLFLKYYSSYYRLIKRFNSQLLDFAEKHNINTAIVDTNITDPALFTDICHLHQQGITMLSESFFNAITKVLDKRFSAT